MKELIIKYMKLNSNSFADLEKVFGLPVNEILSILYKKIKVFEQDFGNVTQTRHVFINMKTKDKIMYTKTFIDEKKVISETIVFKTKDYETILSENLLHNHNV